MKLSALRPAMAAAFASTPLFAQAPARPKRNVSDAEVTRVHKSVPVFDGHNDVTSATGAGLDPGKPNTIYSENTLRPISAVERAAVHGGN